ncbi:MAG: helicase-exonuclease AddAB subunit AddA [Anaerocolumna sp.]
MNWTREQQKIIDHKGANLLVSAAAGSGKTAVLVERIIHLITREDTPIDIDRLLVVTFTNAAAAEMKERIGKAIEHKILLFPEDLNLQKQSTLIHGAQITTIHSFCLHVIRNHFNSIHLDPSFRIADETELTLMKADVLSDILEEYYEEGREEFLQFIESFATGKTDVVIEELILKLYGFAMSYPWPEEWLLKQKENFSLTSVEVFHQAPWMKTLIGYLNTVCLDLLEKCEEAIRLCNQMDGPKAYLPAIKNDREGISTLTKAKDYANFSKLLLGYSFDRLSSKKEEGVSEEVKGKVKALRDDVKKIIGDLQKNYFFQSEEEMVSDIAHMYSPMEVLIGITLRFMEGYANKKSEKNVVDFNDLEHFALNILVKKEGEDEVFTPAADELSEHFTEVMVDEYQDSNMVQELILKSISGERFHRFNRFMVGDVKQSIYKFRLARPEIFMDKYDKYTLWSERMTLEEERESSSLHIDLRQNFRSRKDVLSHINFIFRQIMTKKLGNIAYDEKAALYPGADYDYSLAGVSKETEVLLIDTTVPENLASEEEGEEEDLEHSQRELEALAVAKRMKELVDETTGLMVYDKVTKSYRRARYGDMVILLRTVSGWAEVFLETLALEGIPAHTDTNSGYFATKEIRTILDLLRVIDNPLQDIPFAGVLHSQIVNISPEELARIRIGLKKTSLYEAAISYTMEYEDGLANKLITFFKQLDTYRSLTIHLSIHELILKVLEDTKFHHYVLALPGGVQRRANLDMLVKRALKFESTSYSGLFHFIRYMEKLHKYDVDFGEASISVQDGDTVRIMSIHKSKGLEFPVVFVSGMGKNFNNQDARSKLLIHPDLGLGPDYMDYELRVKAPTLIKKVIQKEIELDNLGEELRVLYVALTRAKEKLILTGGIKDADKKVIKWAEVLSRKEEALNLLSLSHAKTYLDWIMPSLLRYKGAERILEAHGIIQDKENPLYQADVNFFIDIIKRDTIVNRVIKKEFVKKIKEEVFLNWDDQVVYNKDIKEEIKKRFDLKYPYQTETNIHTKLTVSELKKLGQLEVEDLAVPLKGVVKSGEDYPVPSFMAEKEKPSSAQRGSLIHLILEHLIFEKVTSNETLLEYVEELVQGGKITKEEAGSFDLKPLVAFVQSDIGCRMRKAEKEHKLYKERQFIMGVRAKEINDNLKSDESVLVQGIIDAYFEEDDALVLVDYKTDAITADEEDKLIRRYKVQLAYYRKALERLTHKKVKESMIYSFALSKAIIW